MGDTRKKFRQLYQEAVLRFDRLKDSRVVALKDRSLLLLKTSRISGLYPVNHSNNSFTICGDFGNIDLHYSNEEDMLEDWEFLSKWM